MSSVERYEESDTNTFFLDVSDERQPAFVN